jgi:hypothetical protein
MPTLRVRFPLFFVFHQTTLSGAAGPAEVRLELVDSDEQALTQASIRRLVFDDISALPDCEQIRARYEIRTVLGRNPAYYRELAQYLSEHSSCIRTYIKITNSSTFPLTDCKLNLNATMENVSLRLDTQQQMPTRPSTTSPAMSSELRGMFQKQDAFASFDVQQGIGDTCRIRIAKLLPGESFIFKNYLAIIPDETGKLKVSGTLYASELPKPRELEYFFEITVEDTQADIERLKAIVLKNHW